eukprot:9363074-Pyramimonas_sp.AAC.1
MPPRAAPSAGGARFTAVTGPGLHTPVTSWERGAPLTLRLDPHGAPWALIPRGLAAIIPARGYLW